MIAKSGDKLPADVGPGERAESNKQGRFKRLIGACMLLGAAIGVTLSLTEARGETIMTGTMPPAVAIGLVAAVIVAGGLLVWFMTRIADEHERAINHWAGNVGACVYALLYPAWLFLWKARLVPEPDHLVLYFVLLVAIGAAYGYKKIG